MPTPERNANPSYLGLLTTSLGWVLRIVPR
jgi:hypothetical protein